MVMFGTQIAAAQRGQADDFLRKAREELTASFAEFLEHHEEFETVDSFVSALDSQVWHVAEKLLKQSYRNGLARGRSK